MPNQFAVRDSVSGYMAHKQGGGKNMAVTAVLKNPGWRLLAAAILVAATAGCAPRVQTLGPLDFEPVLGDDYLQTRDGKRLPVRAWRPIGAPSAVIIALHGFNDYSNAFQSSAAWWRARGVMTYAFDQRGFGDTEQRGIWTAEEAMISDLGSMIRAVREHQPDVPLYLLGHSMGGAVVMATMAVSAEARGAVDGAILVAPAVWGWSTLNPFYKVGLWLSAHIVPGRNVSGRGLEITPSDNIEMLRALGRDPLVIKDTRIDAVYGLVSLMDRAYRDASRLDGPVLLLYGAKDEIIPGKPVAAVRRHLNGLSRSIVYENGYHMLLRDLQSETVWRDVLDWISRDR